MVCVLMRAIRKHLFSASDLSSAYVFCFCSSPALNLVVFIVMLAHFLLAAFYLLFKTAFSWAALAFLVVLSVAFLLTTMERFVGLHLERSSWPAAEPHERPVAILLRDISRAEIGSCAA